MPPSALVVSIIEQRNRTDPVLDQVLEVVVAGRTTRAFKCFIVAGILRMARRQARLTSLLLRHYDTHMDETVDVAHERELLEAYTDMAALAARWAMILKQD